MDNSEEMVLSRFLLKQCEKKMVEIEEIIFSTKFKIKAHEDGLHKAVPKKIYEEWKELLADCEEQKQAMSTICESFRKIDDSHKIQKNVEFRRFKDDEDMSSVFEEIEVKANRLQMTHKEIIRQILERGFSPKDADYNYGYIRGVQDMLNILFNMDRPKF